MTDITSERVQEVVNTVVKNAEPGTTEEEIKRRVKDLLGVPTNKSLVERLCSK